MNSLPFAFALRRAFLSGLLALLGLPLWAAPAKSLDVSDEAPIELPKYVVTESQVMPPQEPWRHAEFPGFEVLTNASDHDTQRLVREFRLFQTAVSVIWPIAQARTALPTTLILCGRRNAFDAFMPDEKSSAGRGMASLFLADKEQAAIVLDLQASTLNLSSFDLNGSPAVDTSSDDATSPSINNGFRVDYYKQLQREYVHYLLGRSEPRPPAWLEEGLSQLFMSMQYDRKTIRFAQLEDPDIQSEAAAEAAQANANAAAAGDTATPTVTAPAEDQDFNQALHRRGLMPLQAMFEVTHDSSQARNPLGSLWAKQCAAFVHYCLYSTDSKTLQKPLLTFVLRTSKEPPTEALFKECFGMDYKDMITALRSYVDFTTYNHQQYNIKGDGMPEPEPLALRDATDAETGRIKGEALVLAGHADAARIALIAPYIRGERDPRLLASLGLWERTANHDDRARKFLEAAAKGKVVRARAYLELSRMRYTDAQAQPAGANGRFSASQMADILQPLSTARTQLPAMPEVYLLAVATLAKSESASTPEQFAFLSEGIQLFPRNPELLYRTAEYCLQTGRPETAADLIEIGLKVSSNEKATALFLQLKAELPPLPPAPAPTPAARAAPARAR
jgi:hypothetical protein